MKITTSQQLAEHETEGTVIDCADGHRRIFGPYMLWYRVEDGEKATRIGVNGYSVPMPVYVLPSPDMYVWSAEPQGQYRPSFRSKYHVNATGDRSGLSKCGTALLNLPIPDRGVGFGGALSFGDGRARLGDLDRDEVCRRCVPVMPA